MRPTPLSSPRAIGIAIAMAWLPGAGAVGQPVPVAESASAIVAPPPGRRQG